MSNQIRYIRDLEAAGFERKQAEAQVQMVLEVLEGDLVTKSDFAVFQEQMKNQVAQIHAALKESEYRTVTRLGFLTISTVSIAVALLTWLIKV